MKSFHKPEAAFFFMQIMLSYDFPVFSLINNEYFLKDVWSRCCLEVNYKIITSSNVIKLQLFVLSLFNIYNNIYDQLQVVINMA